MNSPSPTWTVHEHIIPASHPRGYRRGVVDPQTSRLRLHVKQYVPSHQSEASSAITLILHHGMPPGAIKEAYEPFLSAVIAHPRCPRVRAIWAADAAGFGQSFLLNKDDIGDEPHWFDSVEDTRHMINHFQSEMRPPLIAIGQSWGCVAILMNAARQARLFQAIVLSEPVIENGWYHANDPRRLSGSLPPASGMGAGRRLTLRKNKWQSRPDAESWHRQHKAYQQYPREVLDQILKYDLREVEDGSVEFVTPASQVFPIFMRPSPPLEGHPEGEEYATRVLPYSDVEKGFYEGMGERIKESMPGINCKTLYLWAQENSFISDDAYRERLVSRTGTGLGGGGGKARGQIDEVFVNGGHFLPLQKPEKTAAALVQWLAETFWPSWLKEEAARVSEPPIDAVHIPDGVLRRLGVSVSRQKADDAKPKL